jgi:hypothetical protein
LIFKHAISTVVTTRAHTSVPVSPAASAHAPAQAQTQAQPVPSHAEVSEG